MDYVIRLENKAEEKQVEYLDNNKDVGLVGATIKRMGKKKSNLCRKDTIFWHFWLENLFGMFIAQVAVNILFFIN